MQGVAEGAASRALELATGAAGCLVGLCVAGLPEDFWNWALARADGAEFVAGRFGPSVALPHDAPWQLHALGEFGPFLTAVGLFALAAWLACRLVAVSSLTATCIAFWVAVPLWAELFRYGWRRGSAPEALLQAIGIPQAVPAAKQFLVLAAVAGLVLALRSGLRRCRMFPLTAFAVPACLVYFMADTSRMAGRTAFGFNQAADLVPAALAGLAGIAATLPTVELRRPSWKGAGLLGVAGLLAFLAPSALLQPLSDRAVPWAETTSAHWRIRFEAERFSPEQRATWAAKADCRLRSHLRRLGLSPEGRLLQVHVAATERAAASLAPAARFDGSYWLDREGGGALLSSPDGLPEDPRAEPLLAMRAAWGEPASADMALALARFAVGGIRGESLAAAAERIACEEAARPEPFDLPGRSGFRSPLARDALGGAWVERAARRHGAGVLRQLYTASIAEGLPLCADCRPACQEVPAAASRPPSLPYLKGISFSHEGRGSAGYGSRAAQRELRRMRETGANAVALVPYAFTGAPDSTSIRFRTLETDARVLRAVRQAHDAGLAVMLKPHLWSGSRFHGDIAFVDDRRFEAWFDDYRRWMLHYARLARIGDVELLSIGNELAGLTRREAAWRALIAEVRRIYRGPVTYAAHWDGEFESLAFWDALDYIGVNFYFPIARRGSPPASDSPEMERAAARISAVQALHGKPVLFTEVGFPALATAAARPWEENGSPLDADLQARCYAAWMERFPRERAVAGMFWWKWPSHGRGSPFDTSHRPLAKPARRVLEEWFGRL